MGKPIAIDLFTGKGGWARGLSAVGWYVIGFDIEDKGHEGGELVLQDVLTLHGSQFRKAHLIVASPPCQNYSYLAMPWSRSKSNNSQKAKAMRRKWETEGPDNRLFDACFRIQREACEAAGHYIPLVVENVKGAQEWVGPAKARYGSYFLWGDVETVNGMLVAGRKLAFGVPTLTTGSTKNGGGSWFRERNGQPTLSNDPSDWFLKSAAVKVPGQDWNNFKNGLKSEAWNDAAVRQMEEETGRKVNHHLNGEVPPGTGKTSWFFGNTKHELRDGVKGDGGSWFGSYQEQKEAHKRGEDTGANTRLYSSRSAARREASARIAMIPQPLAEWIGRVYLP